MPSRWTFEIPPVAEFIERHMPPLTPNGVVVDPFAGRSKWGTHRNDIATGGTDAEEFCNRLVAEGLQADVVLFDPPYSPRQISECYKAASIPVTAKDTQNSALYARVRKPLAKLLRPGGVALSFGWQSTGFGKAWPTSEILLVQHGGAHNDTICVAQRKPDSSHGYLGDINGAGCDPDVT
jgi:hypothetical protein